MMKLGCTLPNLANICLHKSTDTNFYTLTDGDKDLLEKVQKDVVGAPSIVFTRKQLLMKLLFENLQTYANPLMGLMPVNYSST